MIRCCLLACLPLLVGCGSGSGRVGVQGSVSYKDAPLKQGTISFEPMGETRAANPNYSAGSLIKDGTYNIEAEKGLLPGQYSVKISSTSGGAPGDTLPGTFPLAKEVLPEKYNSQTKLTAEITATNPNKKDFPLD